MRSVHINVASVMEEENTKDPHLLSSNQLLVQDQPYHDPLMDHGATGVHSADVRNHVGEGLRHDDVSATTQNPGQVETYVLV